MNSPYLIIDRSGNAVEINLVLELHGGGRIMTPSRCPICGGDAWDSYWMEFLKENN